jgi:hypothetical protein
MRLSKTASGMLLKAVSILIEYSTLADFKSSTIYIMSATFLHFVAKQRRPVDQIADLVICSEQGPLCHTNFYFLLSSQLDWIALYWLERSQQIET